jgi:hypothetical protein
MSDGKQILSNDVEFCGTWIQNRNQTDAEEIEGNGAAAKMIESQSSFLLGESFLKRLVSVEQRNGTLILRQ